MSSVTTTNRPFPEKVYLSGSDCFHLVIDSHAKANKLGGNVMHIALQFDSVLPPTIIIDSLQQSPVIHWLCNIKLKKGLIFSKPYWKYTNNGREIIIDTLSSEIEKTIPTELLNLEMGIKSERFIQGTIVQYANKTSALVISWNHILMDGKGMGLLLNHLQRISSETNESSTEDWNNYFPKTSSSQRKFIDSLWIFYGVKTFIQRSTRGGFKSIATSKVDSTAQAVYQTLRFNPEETIRIDKRAREKGARFGSNLFLLASSIQSVQTILTARNNTGTIWLPIPYDGRKKNAQGPIITNDVAYLFYRLEQPDLKDLETTVLSLQTQMMDEMKINLPSNYKVFLDFMRYFPLWLYYFLVRVNSDKNFASFLYSSTHSNFDQLTNHFNGLVTEINIMAPVVFPPGVTLSFVRQNEQIIANIAYASNCLSEAEYEHLAKSLRINLLDL